MTGYSLDHADGRLRRGGEMGGNLPFLAVISETEFQERAPLFSCHRELLRSLASIRYCKAEWFPGGVAGTIRIPQKGEQSVPPLSFGFFLSEQALVFIEDTGALGQWVEKQLDAIRGIQTPEHLFLQLMELMIGEDILYLSQLERELEDLEASISDHAADSFSHTLTRYRRKLSELNAYYAQLSAIGDQMQAHAASPAWDKYAGRAERLQNHVSLLRENILQIRELFQSLQSARQNRIMGILTVVTTIFLPLTLLTGWYGMNFAHMPELQWPHGYLAVSVAAVIIVVLEILWFRRKKFF